MESQNQCENNAVKALFCCTQALQDFKLIKADLAGAETCNRTPRIVSHHVRKRAIALTTGK